jgi:peptide methionine sulfoxide reductase MsrB
MDDLKKETERDLQCYELCHTKLHDAMDQFDAQEVQISTRDALIEELKRQKADLEKTLENNESYCHQRGMHLAHTFLWVLEQYNTKTQTFRVTDNIIVFIPGRIMN